MRRPIALLALALSVAPAASEPAFFEGASIFEINLPKTQSTGHDRLESFIAGGLMRPVVEFGERSLYRRMGRPVGRLFLAVEHSDGRRGATSCTASLIDADLILTNHHCIVGAPIGTVYAAALDLAYVSRLATDDVARFTVDLEPVEADRKLDYAIHRVRGQPGETFGTIEIDTEREVRPRDPIFILHHPAGEPQTASLGCETNDPPLHGDDILHRCSTLAGSSGAPLFDTETRRVVGLHYTAVERGVNGAKRLAAVVEASPTLQRLTRRDEPAPATAGPSAAATLWARIKDSDEPAVLALVEELYPDAPEAALARERRLAMLSPAAPREQKGPVITACERLVAPLRSRPDLRGVAFEAIDADRAIEACREAAGKHPREPRFAALLGRALASAGRDDEAVRWSRRAADVGDPLGMMQLGWMYGAGRGVEKDENKAVLWSRRAADAGQPRGMTNLGTMYANGLGVEVNEAEAVRWYRRAADAGDARAMGYLGLMYMRGRGIGKDDAEAVRWYRRAAGAGEALGMTNLGVMYEHGRGVEKDEAEAVRWYRRAADADDPRGMTNLGTMYASGHGVEKDEAEAARWYRRAADADDPRGMTSLGYMFANGHGVEKDEAEAVRWYRRAADAGHPPGMINLGTMYASGHGVEKDEAEAVRWYRRAADAGHPVGMSNLGLSYQYGRGVEKDEAEAVRWYRKAVAAGDERSKPRLERLLANR